MSGRHLRRGRWWFVIVVALGSAFGHVCALPPHAHADEPSSGIPGAGGHEPTDDHPLYGASCEAVSSTSAPPLPLAAVFTSDIRVAAPVPQVMKRVAPPVLAPSPPLFLLHAALLI